MPKAKILRNFKNITIGRHLFEVINNICIKNNKNTVVIVDHSISKIYKKELAKNLKHNKTHLLHYTIKSQESFKTAQNLFKILQFLANKKIDKHDTLLAIGGGIVTDMVGLASKLYMRGIEYIIMPTSLLAMVDAGIGGKVAVNLKNGKNLVGAFNEPKKILIDLNFLDTLPKEEFNAGLAEVIKIFCCVKKDSFYKLSNDTLKLDRVIISAVKEKLKIVEIDKYDSGIRQILNFGHTLGHAIEKLSDYNIKHGYAVSIGISVMSKISDKFGFSTYETHGPIVSLLEKYDLPTICPYNSDKIFHAIHQDKKRNKQEINLIFLQNIGKAFIKKIELKDFFYMLNKVLDK